MGHAKLPFALILSKPVLSGFRRQAAAGGRLRKLGFDKLSPNGALNFVVLTVQMSRRGGFFAAVA